MTSRLNTAAAAGLLLLLSLSAMPFNAASARFAWDDTYLVADNPALDDPANLPALFSHPWAWGTRHELGAAKNRAYYRPVAMVSLMLDNLVFGRSPAAFRISSQCLHAAVVLALFALLLGLGAGRLPALAAAALFAVHPAACEVNAIAAYRTTLLEALFSLLCLLAALSRSRRGPWLAGLAALLAMLSKESAVVLVAIVPLVWLATRTADPTPAPGPHAAPPRRFPGLAWAAVAAAAVLALAARSLVASPVPGAVTAYMSLGERTLLACKLFFHCLAVWLVPYPLSAAYDFSIIPPPSGLLDPFVWAGLAAGLAIAGGGALLAVRRHPAGGLLLAFAVALAPFLHLVPFRVLFAVRFLYLPSALLLAAAAVAASLHAVPPPARRGSVPALAVACAVLLLLSADRYRELSSSETILLAEVGHFPDSFNAHFSLARHLAEQGRRAEALEHARRAQDIWPGFEPAVRLVEELQ